MELLYLSFSLSEFPSEKLDMTTDSTFPKLDSILSTLNQTEAKLIELQLSEDAEYHIGRSQQELEETKKLYPEIYMIRDMKKLFTELESGLTDLFNAAKTVHDQISTTDDELVSMANNQLLPTIKIKNHKEVEAWIWQHAQLDGHVCDGVKGSVHGNIVNVAYVDRTTGEKIDVEYELDEDAIASMTSDQSSPTIKVNNASAITVIPTAIVYSVSIPTVSLDNTDIVFHEILFDHPPSRETVMEVIVSTTDFSEGASPDNGVLVSERILKTIDQVTEWVMLLDTTEWISSIPISLQLMENTTEKAHSYIVNPPFTWVKKTVFTLSSKY